MVETAEGNWEFEAGEGILIPAAELRVEVFQTTEGDHVVSRPAGIDCQPTTCAKVFPINEIVELEAIPKERFEKWTNGYGNHGTCSGSTNPCKVIVERNSKVLADFKK